MQAFTKKFTERWKEAMGRFFRFDFLPRRQFRRLTVATFALGLVIVGLHAYLFYRVEGHTIFAARATAQAPAPVVNEGQLGMVLQRFEDKAIIRSTAVELVPAVPDPSN